MRTSEGLAIFELQGPYFGSFATLLGLFPLSFLIIPFLRPTLLMLVLTYIFPIIPAIVTFDGLISAWRTRSYSHVLHLAELAAMRVNLEGGDKECIDWKWEHGSATHTWPWGKVDWIVGRRDRAGDETQEGKFQYT